MEMCRNVQNANVPLSILASLLALLTGQGMAAAEEPPLRTKLTLPHAATANRAYEADHADRTDTADYAANAGQLGGYDLNWVRNNGIYAASANTANTANWANGADSANWANTANTAAWASAANTANTANVATSAYTSVNGYPFLSTLHTRYQWENAGYSDCTPGTAPVLTMTGWDLNNAPYYQYFCISVR